MNIEQSLKNNLYTNTGKLFLVLVFFLWQNSNAQSFKDEKYQCIGKVNKIEISENSLSKSKIDSKPKLETLWLNLEKKVLKKEDNYSIEEYFYLGNGNSNYILKKSGKSYYYNTMTSDNKPILSATINENGKFENIDSYVYDNVGGYQRHFFNSDNEIYSETIAKPISLSGKVFSSDLVPFVWDTKTTTCLSVKDIGFENDRKEEKIVYKVTEKNKPNNWIDIYYDGPNDYDAGKGYWNKYISKVQVEQRPIYKNEEVADFGTSLSYNSKGKLLSKNYGYFDGRTPMQSEISIYDPKGNIIKRQDYEDGRPTTLVNYTYKYDTQGNWIEQKSLYEDGSGTLIKRIITYFNTNEKPIEISINQQKTDEIAMQVATELKKCEAKYELFKIQKKKQDNTPNVFKNFNKIKNKDYKSFLSPGWKLDTIAAGDLNKDSIPDLVMVSQLKKILKQKQNT
jgi:hypothetical protein